MPEQILTRSFDLDVTKRVDTDESSSNKNLVLEFPFSSEEPYTRSSFFDDPWVEVLGHKDSEIDLSRLDDGAPVLLNHGMSRTENAPLRSIGKTTRAWIENGRGFVEIKLSRRDDMRSVLQDLEDELIPNVSVGYRILERTLTKKNDGSPDEYRVTSWLPMEVTLCDIPADATVGIGRSINSEETSMPVTKTEEKSEQVIDQNIAEVDSARSVKAEDKPIDTSKIQSDAVKAERRRTTEIKQICRSVSVDESVVDDLIERGVTVDEARKEVLENLANRTSEQNISSRSDIHTLVDETETRRDMMEAALLHRANPSTQLPDGARQFAGLSLLELSRENMRVRGVNTNGMDKMQVAGRAFEATSDLPNVLANVANKSLRNAYEAAPRTFQAWARQASASDFKPINKMVLSDAPSLETVNENGEFKRGAVTDGKETYQLATVGKIIGLTRQAIINDDLSAFTRLPAMFATSAANYESDTVYGILTANAPLADGVALFHATHKNLTGTGTAISINSLSEGRKKLRKQKTIKGVSMNLGARYFLVPTSLETAAEQIVSQQYLAAQSANINPFAGRLQVIVEDRLDESSETAWYLLADNSVIDTVEYCYLEGNSGVYIETRQGFDVDGMEIKARLDFAAKAIDYRGVYKNNGA